MSNNLSHEKQTQVIHALAEGNAIRAIERMTGIHRDTIMRLGVRVGQNCEQIMDEKMHHLDCRLLQFDEIWGFIGKKQKNATHSDRRDGLGDCWTFVAVDAESRMVPAYLVSSTRRKHDAVEFCDNVASRLNGRVQISTDALGSYADAIERGFGASADYGQIVKVFGEQDLKDARRYSPPNLVEVKRIAIAGEPIENLISTSYVERQNLTMRMHMRRLTRLTNAFSKKFENFKAAVSLHFAYYNFVRIHKTLRCTPAMAGGVADCVWNVEDLLQ